MEAVKDKEDEREEKKNTRKREKKESICTTKSIF